MQRQSVRLAVSGVDDLNVGDLAAVGRGGVAVDIAEVDSPRVVEVQCIGAGAAIDAE
jgi:hypothetical protein